MRGEDLFLAIKPLTFRGSPPHARGRHIALKAANYDLRITPACAGKTTCLKACIFVDADHPRMRGEDVFAPFVPPFERGSPPHARGRPGCGGRLAGTVGITPACAGKTRARLRWATSSPDHPRMRGEDFHQSENDHRDGGSPPHARGRQLDSPGNPAKSSSSLPVFFCSQPSPLGWFLRWVLGLGLNLWKQR